MNTTGKGTERDPWHGHKYGHSCIPTYLVYQRFIITLESDIIAFGPDTSHTSSWRELLRSAVWMVGIGRLRTPYAALKVGLG